MFKQARLKLTAWYLGILMFISLSFSGLIFQMVSQEIDRFAHAPRFRIEEQLMFNDDLIGESKKRVLWSLLELNGLILLAAGSLSYLLAGKTLKPIETMLEEQKRFVSDASHEIRTPLTALKSMIEVGQRDPRPTLKKHRLLLADSLDETNKIITLSNSLLELALEDQSQVVNSVLVKNLINQAVSKVSLRAKAKKIRLISHTNGAKIIGNQAKLLELFLILLDNAVKYSPNGGQITINAHEDTHRVTITVSDTGIGVSPEDLPHIFERFYRADSARSKSGEGGYGLGLSIAKKIVEENNGKIEVKSQLNQGSQFSVIFQK